MMISLNKNILLDFFASIYNRLLRQLFLVTESTIRNISGALGCKLRAAYYSRRSMSCGKDLFIDEGVIIQGIEHIEFGNNVWIDKYCILIAGAVTTLSDDNCRYKRVNKNYNLNDGELIIGSNIHFAPFCIVQAHGGIYIADNVGLSSGVKIYSLSNMPLDSNNPSRVVNFSPLASNPFYLMSQVVIEENVGIGLNAMILPGVIIKQNSFIAPNALVMSSVSENSFMSGNPAKRVKERFSDYGK